MQGRQLRKHLREQTREDYALCMYAARNYVIAHNLPINILDLDNDSSSQRNLTIFNNTILRLVATADKIAPHDDDIERELRWVPVAQIAVQQCVRGTGMRDLEKTLLFAPTEVENQRQLYVEATEIWLPEPIS